MSTNKRTRGKSPMRESVTPTKTSSSSKRSNNLDVDPLLNNHNHHDDDMDGTLMEEPLLEHTEEEEEEEEQNTKKQKRPSVNLEKAIAMLAPEEKKEEKYDDTPYAQPLLSPIEEEEKAPISTVEDSELLNLDIDKAVQDQKHLVKYVGGSMLTINKADNRIVSKEVCDPTQYLLRLLGLEPLYWNWLYEHRGTDLGIEIKRIDSKDPTSQKKYWNQVNTRFRINQPINCPGFHLKKMGLWVALPMTRGIKNMKGPPFGNIGGKGTYDKKPGHYNEAMMSGGITPSNAVPCDVEDRPAFQPAEGDLPVEILTPRLSAAMQWINKSIYEPVSNHGTTYFLDPKHPENKPMFVPFPEEIWWRTSMYAKKISEESLPLYSKAFGKTKVDPVERVKLQRKLAWTSNQIKEKGCVTQELLNLPIYRLVMKDDEDKHALPYSIVPFEDWKQYHEDVIDYENDLFIQFVSPNTVEPGKEENANLYHMNWSLEMILWCGKMDYVDFTMWSKFESAYNPKAMVDKLFTTLKQTLAPVPLDAEKAWLLKPIIEAEKTHELNYQKYLEEVNNPEE